MDAETLRRAGPHPPLPFGVPQLDALMARGVATPGELPSFLTSSTSLTILGQDGTGKSVFALHAAAEYLTRAIDALPTGAPLPVVVYLSTDLRFQAAKAMWDAFLLEFPHQRYVPFISGEELRNRRMRMAKGHNVMTRIELVQCLPHTSDKTDPRPSLPSFLNERRARKKAAGLQHEAKVAFVDLADHTMGDDWLYAARLVALFRPERDPAHPLVPHMLVLDSVAGFETLVGARNSFGDEMSRRSRIAQLIRGASDYWHAVFVVEESETENGHQPEEYVSDTVIHLRRAADKRGERRTLEIEKSRGRAIGAGRHPFEMRSGAGSSTGLWENADDPRTVLHASHVARISELTGADEEGLKKRFSSYIQVFPSLDHLNREISEQVSEELSRRTEGPLPSVEPGPPGEQFGIPFLDEMLGATATNFGLPAGSVCALIGEGSTKKEALAEQFVLQPYQELPGVLAFAIYFAQSWQARAPGRDVNEFIADDDALPQCRSVTSSYFLTSRASANAENRIKGWLGAFEKRREDLRRLSLAEDWGLPRVSSGRSTPARGREAGPLLARWDVLDHLERRTAGVLPWERQIVLALAILRMSVGLVQPMVLVTTHDKSSTELSERVIRRCRDRLIGMLTEFHILETQDAEGRFDGQIAPALRRVLERNMHVRRIAAQSLSGPELWHVISRQVERARLASGLSEVEAQALRNGALEKGTYRGVRVVISDLRLIRDVYPNVADDPLFLPTLVFRLRRYGVTSLIVDSDHGRPGVAPTHPQSWALRSLVDRQILTWQVPFFGEQRVAITVNPPMSTGASGLIRELVSREQDPSGDTSSSRAVEVNPRFELFAGLESGQPEAIPLKIVLCAETPAFEAYARSEEPFLSRLFTKEVGSSTVASALGTHEFQALRDYSQLPVAGSLSYTLVFVLNGYWAMGKESALKDQTSWLLGRLESRDALSGQDAIEPVETRMSESRAGNSRRIQQDFYGLFHDGDTQPSHRYSRFSITKGPAGPHYTTRIPENDPSIDRVPFTWDFGFLLCDERQWIHAEKVRLPSRPKVTVGDVWHRLRVVRALRDKDGKDLEDGVKVDREKAQDIGWREFLEACSCIREVERRRGVADVVAFDVAISQPDDFLCLLLEVWMSEILEDVGRFGETVARLRKVRASPEIKRRAEALCAFAEKWCERARRRIRVISARYYKAVDDDGSAHHPTIELSELLLDPEATESGGESVSRLLEIYGDLVKAARNQGADFLFDAWLGEGSTSPGAALAELVPGISALLLQKDLARSGYSLQLYKAWLLLLEVLDLELLASPEPGQGLIGEHMPSNQAVAARHWYKTAAAFIQRERAAPHEGGTTARCLVPVQLPGHCSVRGDWFLAVAKGSRSHRLGDMALDVLTSRRANRARLTLGIGLPTRRIVDEAAAIHMRTALSVMTFDGEKNVAYGKLLELGGTFAEYCSEPERSLLWVFRSGFANYDAFAAILRDWAGRLVLWTKAYRMQSRGTWIGGGGFQPYDQLVSGDLTNVANFESFKIFAGRLDALLCELESHHPTARAAPKT